MHFVRSPFNYDRRAASVAASLVFDPLNDDSRSRTRQSEREDADINVIVRKFGLTGVVPPNPRVPTYGDFTGVSDFQSALNAVRDAELQFMALPAHVRAEFDNDPQKLMAAFEDPKMFKKLYDSGLIDREKFDKMSSAADKGSVSESKDGKVNAGTGASGGSSTSGDSK